MGKIWRTLALLLTLIMALSCLTLHIVKPVNAQSIPKPSAPQFTVQYVVYTSYIEPTYTTNPYTGQNQTVDSGGQVTNQTIGFTIKNQAFSPYTDSNGNPIGLYYNFRVKGHFTDTWTQYPFAPTSQSTWQSTWRYSNGPLVPQTQNLGSPEYPASKSEYTYSSVNVQYFSLQNVPANSQVDFQVQAMIGHIDPITYQMNPNIGGDGYYSFTGQASEWSPTQTLTITGSSNSTSASVPTQQPIASPTVPEFPIAVAILLLAVASVLLFTLRKERNSK
jgi:hypothetical protein